MRMNYPLPTPILSGSGTPQSANPSDPSTSNTLRPITALLPPISHIHTTSPRSEYPPYKAPYLMQSSLPSPKISPTTSVAPNYPMFHQYHNSNQQYPPPKHGYHPTSLTDHYFPRSASPPPAPAALKPTTASPISKKSKHRRQSHILAEQRRRENINAGFESLRACLRADASQAATLHLASSRIKHLEAAILDIHQSVSSGSQANDQSARIMEIINDLNLP